MVLLLRKMKSSTHRQKKLDRILTNKSEQTEARNRNKIVQNNIIAEQKKKHDEIHAPKDVIAPQTKIKKKPLTKEEKAAALEKRMKEIADDTASMMGL